MVSAHGRLAGGGDAPGAGENTVVVARTDVVAAGVLAFGQHVELQWHLPTA